MKAGAVRRAAKTYDSEQLAAAVEAVVDNEEEILEIDGDDMGERLTHLLLAQRVRARMDEGVELKVAFREVLGDVRETLANE